MENLETNLASSNPMAKHNIFWLQVRSLKTVITLIGPFGISLLEIHGVYSRLGIRSKSVLCGACDPDPATDVRLPFMEALDKAVPQAGATHMKTEK